jgi:hypothetical protein
LSMRFIRLNDCAAVGTQVLFPAADKYCRSRLCRP